jgi:hypothetical protein
MLTTWSRHLRSLLPALLAVALAGAGCGGAVPPEAGGGPEETGGGEGNGADAGPDADAGPAGGGNDGGANGGSDGGSDGGATGSATAPANALPGEVLARSDNPVTVSGGGSVLFRFEAPPDAHVALRLEFPASTRGVKLSALRWDGARAVPLGLTDAGPGLRLLAVFEPGGPRTHWARVDATVDALAGARLLVTSTPFADGLACKADCARLLQLPLPRGAGSGSGSGDGYSLSGAIFRYQFGRRDLLQLLRSAGRRVVAQGRRPFQVADLSQWDGQTPGTDVGAPRHASHQRGKDVDLALYGADEQAVFRSFCTVRSVDGGRECTPGTRSPLFEALYNARLLAAFYAGGRVTMDFLDRELIAAVRPAAQTAAQDGSVEPALLPLYSDGSHLQHWPNHDNHVHVRVSEAAYLLNADGSFAPVPEEPFEAP